MNAFAEDDLQRRRLGLVARRYDLDRDHRCRPTFTPSSSAGWLLGSGRCVPLGQFLPPGIIGWLGNLSLRAPLPHAPSAPPPPVDHLTPILLLRRTPLRSLRHRSPLGLKSKPRVDLSQAIRGYKMHSAGRLRISSVYAVSLRDLFGQMGSCLSVSAIGWEFRPKSIFGPSAVFRVLPEEVTGH